MNKWLRNILIVLQIGGGVFGLFLVGSSLMAQELEQIAVIVHGAFFIVFVFGIAAGWALIKKPGLGLVLSLIYQGLQIPIYLSSVLSYDMFSGARFYIYWHETGFGFNYIFFGSRFYFSINSGEAWFAGVNVLALVLFILLIREMWLKVSVKEISESEPAEVFYRPAYRTW
ncbi:MAG: hypothetical protein ACYTBP_13740 [Planctomycetota bacterium]|jgi:hypothetical protein